MLMVAYSKEAPAEEKVRSVVFGPGRPRRKVKMKVLRDAVLVEDHQRNARRAMERVFGRIEKRSLVHSDSAGTENAPRFESNAGLGVGIDLAGKVRTA
jgi:hypothetical protein